MVGTVRRTAEQAGEGSPWDKVPRLLLRDRDGIDGAEFHRRVPSMGIDEAIIAARSPWQSREVEPFVGNGSTMSWSSASGFRGFTCSHFSLDRGSR